MPSIILLLPVILGSVGASLGNYTFDTARNRRKKISKVVVGIIPAFINWILVLIVYIAPMILMKMVNHILGLPLWILNFIAKMSGDEAVKINPVSGIEGFMLKICILTFIFILIKKLEENGCLHGRVNYKVMTILLILGGAPGALFGCIIFNYKNRNELNTIKYEDFLYSKLIWVLGITQWIVITLGIWNRAIEIMNH